MSAISAQGFESNPPTGSPPGSGSESALAQARAETSALLHEVDHRVKNNLQLISSLILLQSRRVESPVAREALRGVLERVSAIAIVHRRLFEANDLQRFDVAQFIHDLVKDLMAVSGRDDLQVALDLQRADIPAARAASVALILNELVSNAIRHAYPQGQAGALEIVARRRNGDVEIIVCDRGVGLANPARPVRGFGLTITDLLCKQLSADCSFTDAEPGVRASVRLPIDPADPHAP